MVVSGEISVWNCVKKKKKRTVVANLVVNDNIREVDVSQDEGACLAHVSLTSSKGKLLVFQLDTDNCNATEPCSGQCELRNLLDKSLEINGCKLNVCLLLCLCRINSPGGENIPIRNS